MKTQRNNVIRLYEALDLSREIRRQHIFRTLKIAMHFLK